MYVASYVFFFFKQKTAYEIPKVFSLQDKQLIEPHDVGVLIENNCQSAPARCHSRHGFR